MARRYQTPDSRAQWFDQGGKPTPVAYQYLAGLQEVSGRTAGAITDLPTAGTSTTAEIEAKINEILAANRAAQLQDT